MWFSALLTWVCWILLTSEKSSRSFCYQTPCMFCHKITGPGFVFTQGKWKYSEFWLLSFWFFYLFLFNIKHAALQPGSTTCCKCTFSNSVNYRGCRAQHQALLPLYILSKWAMYNCPLGVYVLCIYIYIYVYIHIHTRVYIYIHTRVYM